MINTIASTIKTKLLELNLFERFGGIVKPYTKVYKNGTSITMPIAHDVDGETCFETQKHKELVPNDQFKSVAYIEQRTDAVEGLSDKYPKRTPSYSVGLRLVCWVNLAKLGQADPSVVDRIVLTIQKKLRENDRFITVTESGYTGSQIQIQSMSLVNGTKTDIFGPYSHSEFNKHLVYPFAYFAIDFNAILHLGDACFTEFTAQTEIECPEL